MKTQVTKTPLADLVVVNIDYFKDARGFFIESWNKKDFAEAGLAQDFVQDSHSRSGYRCPSWPSLSRYAGTAWETCALHRGKDP